MEITYDPRYNIAYIRLREKTVYSESDPFFLPHIIIQAGPPWILYSLTWLITLDRIALKNSPYFRH